MTGVRPLPPKKKHNMLQGALIIFLVGFTMYVLLQSTVFEVRQIEIVGRNEISQDELIKLSGVVLGSNIFKLDLMSGEEKIRLLPMIKEVKLLRKYPSTVVIEILERKPVALLPFNEGFLTVDIEGIYLREGSINSDSLPVITGYNDIRAVPGQRVENEKVATGLQVIGDLPAPLVENLSEIHIDRQNRVFIYTTDGIQGRLGLAEKISSKGEIFLQVIEQISQDQPVDYVDISSFKSPVVKYADEARGGAQ
ncbi:cell division protein FtsQ/DivIB [Desulfofalx alkaliphila]|uniref:cell division protein FtsQ/DivIB n=1 Tax=Desulfofalx alkaliphila TaxID=105483 RepID=UPI0004E142FD|nr:FtsQ-type POTRA domain-containing protein [Desulfofalx alkaliphila]